MACCMEKAENHWPITKISTVPIDLYLSRALQFGYKDFGSIVTSPHTATRSVGPSRTFCSCITTVASFLHTLKFKHDCEVVTQTFYD